MSAQFNNLFRFTAASAGTGNFVVSAAVAGFLTPELGNAIDGKVYYYFAHATDGSGQWEWGSGVYSRSSHSQSRTTITSTSAKTTSAVNFANAPIVDVFPSSPPLLEQIPMRGALAGLTLSTAGSSATFSVAAGAAADSTNNYYMQLPVAMSKTTATWVAGTGNGAIDTGSVSTSTWYHVHLIKRLDTGLVDVLFSLSPTAPTLPTNYTLFRRIGSMQTNASSQWVLFYQLGDEFLWDAWTSDVAANNPGTSAVLRTLTVPIGVHVYPIMGVGSQTIGGTDGRGVISSPDTPAPGYGSSSINYGGAATSLTGTLSTGVVATNIRTNTSAQVRTLNGASDVNTYLFINTMGWIDRRGRDD